MKITFFWISLVLVVVVLGVVLSVPVSPVSASDCYLPTVDYVTPTLGAWASPTPVRTGTQSVYMPCPENTQTPLYPGVILPTSEFLNTPVPPAATATPVYSGSKLRVSVETYRNWYDSTNFDGILSCVNESGQRIDHYAGAAAGVLEGYDITCLGVIGINQHFWEGYMSVTSGVRLVDQISDITAYYDFDSQGTPLGGFNTSGLGSGSCTVGWNNGGSCGRGSYYQVGRSDGRYEIYFYYHVSTMPISGGSDPTPTPTPVPCQEVPDYTSEGPLVEFPELVYARGNCITLMPGFTLPFGGAYDLPDMVVPLVSLCPIYVDIQGRLFNFDINVWLGIFLVLGFGFAVYNEFRS